MQFTRAATGGKFLAGLRQQTQRERIGIYENDFAKHNGEVNSGRLPMVFRSIVPQLAKSNGKLMCGVYP